MLLDADDDGTVEQSRTIPLHDRMNDAALAAAENWNSLFGL